MPWSVLGRAAGSHVAGEITGGYGVNGITQTPTLE